MTLLAAASVALACGTSKGPSQGAAAPVLIIAGFSVTPARVTVPPGGTIIVFNDDVVKHTITSSASAGSGVPGPVNGVSIATPPFLREWTIPIPADAPVGTVIPYFCEIHPDAPLERGEIDIVPP